MSYNEMTDQEFKIIAIKIVWIVIFLVIFLLVSCNGISPIYNVWHQKLEGEAELARAESNRQIRILEAHAEMEASKSLSEAEIIRAEGVAKANKIIGNSLENNEGYLRYLWIRNLQTNNKEIVYIPTEANLPILEANRMKKEE